MPPSAHYRACIQRAFVTAEVLKSRSDSPDLIDGMFYLILNKRCVLDGMTVALTGSISYCSGTYTVVDRVIQCKSYELYFGRQLKSIPESKGETYQPGEYSWPFSFELPETAAWELNPNNEKSHPDTKLRDRFHLDLYDAKGSPTRIPLPPSSHVSFHKNCQSKGVTYKVEIFGPRVDNISSRLASVNVDFRILTSQLLTGPMLRDAHEFLQQGQIYCKNAVATDVWLPVDEKFLRRPLRLPIKVYVRFPSQIQLENSRPFPFEVVLKIPKTKSVQLPPMDIKDVRLTLHSTIDCYYSSSSTGYSLLQPGQEVCHRLVFQTDESNGTYTAIVDVGAVLGLALPGRRDPGALRASQGELQPTFTTWTWKVWHHLVFSFHIAWEGGSYFVSNNPNGHQGDIHHVEVLPRYKDQGDALFLDRTHDYDEPPPSYTSAVKDSTTA